MKREELLSLLRAKGISASKGQMTINIETDLPPAVEIDRRSGSAYAEIMKRIEAGNTARPNEGEK